MALPMSIWSLQMQVVNKKFGIVRDIMFPDGPKHCQHFALGIESCMDRVPGAPQGGFIKERYLIRVDGSKGGRSTLVAFGFQGPRSRTAKTLVRQWFACTAALANPEPAILPYFPLVRKPVRRLNKRAEYMRTHYTNTRHALELRDLWITVPEFNHRGSCFFLESFGCVQLLVQILYHRAPSVCWQLLQIGDTMLVREHLDPTHMQQTSLLILGLDLGLQTGQIPSKP